MCWCLTKAAFKLIMACFRLADGVTDLNLGQSIKEGSKLYKTLEETEKINWLLENNLAHNILTVIGSIGVLVGMYEFYWGFLACCNPCGGKTDDEDKNNKWIAKVNIFAFVVEDLPSLAINVFILAFANGGSGSGDGSDSAITRRLDGDGAGTASGSGGDDAAGDADLTNVYISMGVSAGAGLMYVVKYFRAKSNLEKRGIVSQL